MHDPSTRELLNHFAGEYSPVQTIIVAFAYFVTNRNPDNLFTDVDVNLLTARRPDDFDLDTQTVSVVDCGLGPVVVSAVAENKVEGQGIEVFLLSIIPDAAYMIGKPSIATVYIKGMYIVLLQPLEIR